LELDEYVTLQSGRRVLVRPIRPDDERAHAAFADRLATDDVRFRFFTPRGRLSPHELVRLTHIDYEREMAFVAIAPDDEGRPETLGVVRVVAEADERERVERAIVVRSDLNSLGHLLAHWPE
jgi:acetyltransferase